ncbi:MULTISPECIES: FaeA/PapI family transcriptional regulator [Serratia]|uniref:FaeA/PapI family transcriptional regulator n=1 Tax=Serratia TaxID=613 RepID=UPI00235E95C6|nr:MULTISPECIES: FaeA/PapI family transcriptional regulator [Serratia]
MMISSTMPIHQPYSPFHHAILMTLFQLAPPLNNGVIPRSENWPTTRQIADAHNISIYQARYALLGLVALGRVLVSDGAVNNSLRWYPHEQPES